MLNPLYVNLLPALCFKDCRAQLLQSGVLIHSVVTLIIQKETCFSFYRKMNENEVSDLINQIFPENYEYKILNYEKFEMGTDDVKFCFAPTAWLLALSSLSSAIFLKCRFSLETSIMYKI